MSEATPLLEVQDLTLRFGGLTALDRISFTVRTGEIVAVIGPNGAGKTSLFNAVSGICRPTQGRILLDGAEVALPMSKSVFRRIIIIGLATGFAAMLAWNCVGLWQAVISSHYRWREPFPWGRSLGSLWEQMRPSLALIGPMFAGGLIGAGAAWSLWSRERRTPELMARAGIGRTFQNLRLFRDLSVRDNVLVGMHPRLGTGFLDGLLRLPRHRREEREARHRASELLSLLGLAFLADRNAASLPYGHQRRLEIARALAGSPRLLLLDEPAAGLNPVESRELMRLIRLIRDRGVTVLLIEHDMQVVTGISDRVVVLDYGAKIAEGTPAQVQDDANVIEAYLGKASGIRPVAAGGPP